MSSSDNKDFYEIWENAVRNEVADYEAEDGFKTQAIKNEWITRCPDVLTMCVNRLAFDRESNRASKTLHKVPIEKVIYTDAFLFENRDRVLKVRELVEGKRANIAVLQTCLSQYNTFMGS